MQIGAVGMSFQPYIYNTNYVSANSLNKISPIEDDALKSSVDYNSSRNQNPLKMGQTANFADVLAMQFQLGQNNAARIMKPAAEFEAADTAESEAQAAENLAEPVNAQTEAVIETTAENTADLSQSFSQGGASAYMMSRAIDAYTMSMAV
ncbi:MAG: hypothetical protein IJ711_05900 [Lachnospiraceae bacterium]|nr:hypothetical protein [Lachnospiraceae bacterium]